MKKEITTATSIKFNATGDKYKIISQTSTGFEFKPVKFEKDLPTVLRTFEEVAEQFLNGDIDIDGFEHNDSDNMLVKLIMDGYMKDSLIQEYKVSVSTITNEKTEVEGKLSLSETSCADLKNQNSEQASTIQSQEQKILSHEATISEQQTVLQEQKDFMQGQKDAITERDKTILNITSKLEKEKQSHESDIQEWNKEKEGFETTIEGLEATIPETVK